MSVRRIIHRFLIVFGIVVIASFCYGAYLMHSRVAPPESSASSTAATNSIDELLHNAMLQLNSKHVEQALIAYRKALTFAPNSVDVQSGIAQAELMAGRESVAALEYERVLKLDHDNAAALRQLGRIYSHERERWSGSEAKYREFLRLKPDDAEAQLEFARVLAWERKPKEAVEIFSRDRVRPLLNIQDQKDYAFALVQTGRSGEAEPLLKKLSTTLPRNSEVRLQLASIYAARRDWSKALPLYEALLRENPSDARLNLTYGSGLLAMKNYKSALRPLERARTSMPSSSAAGLAYARALKGSGNLKKAAKEFGRVVATTNDAGLIREYADLLLEKRDYRGAEKSYKQAMRSGLRDSRLLLGLAGALRGNGKTREAIPYLEEAYAKEPRDGVAFELASALQKAGHHKEALSVLSRIER
jgi:tetratricopeptide (TPR) repeat protein